MKCSDIINIFCTLIFTLLLTSLISIKASSSDEENKYKKQTNNAAQYLTAMQDALQSKREALSAISSAIENAKKQSAAKAFIDELDRKEWDALKEVLQAVQKVSYAQELYDAQTDIT